MKRAITNQLAYKDLTVTPGESQWGDGLGVVGNTDANGENDVQSNIDTLTSTITTVINDGNLTNLPSETVGGNIPDGEASADVTLVTLSMHFLWMFATTQQRISLRIQRDTSLLTVLHQCNGTW